MMCCIIGGTQGSQQDSFKQGCYIYKLPLMIYPLLNIAQNVEEWPPES